MTTLSKLALSVLATTAVLCAQSSTASIRGVIKDAAGTAVAGAEIKITQTATSDVRNATSGADGTYILAALPAGAYLFEVNKPGFNSYRRTDIELQGNTPVTIDVSLVAAGAPATGAPSLGDLGFAPKDVQGNAAEQARLDRRSHMLKIHQRLGLITAAPLIATIITSSMAKERHGSTGGRDLHAALGSVTAGMYLTTASFAIFAPKISGTTTRGPIRLHKALAWIHGPGMILTPILGALAYQQINRGEKVHGIASAHSAVAYTTAVAYGAAILSVSIKF
jgi:hypothetical protein